MKNLAMALVALLALAGAAAATTCPQTPQFALYDLGLSFDSPYPNASTPGTVYHVELLATNLTDLVLVSASCGPDTTCLHVQHLNGSSEGRDYAVHLFPLGAAEVANMTIVSRKNGSINVTCAVQETEIATFNNQSYSVGETITWSNFSACGAITHLTIQGRFDLLDFAWTRQTDVCPTNLSNYGTACGYLATCYQTLTEAGCESLGRTPLGPGTFCSVDMWPPFRDNALYWTPEWVLCYVSPPNVSVYLNSTGTCEEIGGEVLHTTAPESTFADTVRATPFFYLAVPSRQSASPNSKVC
jgi:hypothetical protein